MMRGGEAGKQIAEAVNDSGRGGNLPWPDFVQPQAADDGSDSEDQNREGEVELDRGFRPVFSAQQRLFENAPAVNGSETDLHAHGGDSYSPTVWKAFCVHRCLLG